MARFDDFNFENDDPGPDTDPVPEYYDEEIPIEYYDEANYDEPGADYDFPGDAVSIWDGVGNAENPTEKRDHQAPVVSERNDDAYWRDQVEKLRERQYAEKERAAIQGEDFDTELIRHKLVIGKYGDISADAYGNYVPFDFEPPETAGMTAANRAKVFQMMEYMRNNVSRRNMLDSLGFHGNLQQPKESGTQEAVEPKVRVESENPFASGSGQGPPGSGKQAQEVLDTGENEAAELEADLQEAAELEDDSLLGRIAKGVDTDSLTDRILRAIFDPNPGDPNDPTGIGNWLAHIDQDAFAEKSLLDRIVQQIFDPNPADPNDPTGINSWLEGINLAEFNSETLFERIFGSDKLTFSTGIEDWIDRIRPTYTQHLMRSTLFEYTDLPLPSAVFELTDPTGLRNFITRVEPTYTAYLSDDDPNRFLAKTGLAWGQDVVLSLPKLDRYSVDMDETFEELEDFELEFWEGLA